MGCRISCRIKLWIQPGAAATSLATKLLPLIDSIILPARRSFDSAPTDLPFAILLTNDVPVSAWALRRRSDALAHVPLLALKGLDHPAENTAEIDEWLTLEQDVQALAATIAAWRPERDDATDRLSTIFDARQITDLRRRFRNQLVEALAVVDAPAVELVGHRVAGIAGMLGYTKLGALWANAPVGDGTVLRRETRKAIFAISLIEQR